MRLLTVLELAASSGSKDTARPEIVASHETTQRTT